MDLTAAIDPDSDLAVAVPAPRVRWNTPWRRTFIDGVGLDALTEDQCVDAVLRGLDLHRGGGVVTHNLDHFRRLETDPGFARLCGPAAPPALRDRSIYLRGGDAGPADAAARSLRHKSPSLKIAGTYCPPIGFEK